MSDIPLTPEQRKFAAEHHSLVYAYLNDKHLSENEFYDVVIFGYLKAVYDYLSKKELRRYDFSTIAWRDMSRSLSNYFRDLRRQKRSANVISIHISKYGHEDTGLSLEETIAPADEFMQQLETRLLLHDLSKRISEQQMDMVRLKSYGYSYQDIARKQNISKDQVKRLLNEVRHILKAMCCEG